jgi:antitoxin component of MazEF toxin-antitoxin module
MGQLNRSQKPKKVLQADKLHINQPLAVSIQGDSILLTPVVDENELTLEHMLKGVTPELVGSELNWGKDVSAEKYE